jgi:3-oxoacyl-[acyl-carrier protein] reductase
MMTAYCASKFAIRSLTQSAALELGKYNIQVNAYAPGAIETPMNLDVAATMGAKWEDIKAKESASVPAGRVGYPEDIADLISFLASSQSSFITGQTIMVNGGRLFD